MDKTWKRKWLKALRSGEYVQTGYRLCVRGEEYDKFCCLGVLCDLDSRASGEPWTVNTSGEMRYQSHTALIPPQLLEKTQMKYDEALALSSLNDGGVSFKTIANWIKENL